MYRLLELSLYSTPRNLRYFRIFCLSVSFVETVTIERSIPWAINQFHPLAYQPVLSFGLGLSTSYILWPWPIIQFYHLFYQSVISLGLGLSTSFIHQPWLIYGFGLSTSYIIWLWSIDQLYSLALLYLIDSAYQPVILLSLGLSSSYILWPWPNQSVIPLGLSTSCSPWPWCINHLYIWPKPINQLHHLAYQSVVLLRLSPSTSYIT